MNITYHEASKALNASIEKAKELSIPVSIAVVDHGGHLIAFARLDSVYGVIDFAVKKAKTAVMFGVDSEIMGTIVAGAAVHGYGMLNSNGGLLTIPGGVVIKDADGNIIGAVGSSGGTVEQDKENCGRGSQSTCLIFLDICIMAESSEIIFDKLVYSCAFEKYRGHEEYIPEHFLGFQLSGETHAFYADGNTVVTENQIVLVRKNQLIRSIKYPGKSGKISVYLDFVRQWNPSPICVGK